MKHLKLLAPVLVICLALISCGGDAEQTQAQKISDGSGWTCTSWKINSVEVLAITGPLTVDFNENLSMSYTLNSVPGVGTWSVNESDSTFTFTAGEINGTNMTIIALTSTSFHTQGNGTSNGNPCTMEYTFTK